MPSPEHFDVLIVGAGLSGIGAGFHLQQNCPGKSYVILEGRDCIGGTWDLFRYPGIRSDSDMFTLGYSFKPWTEPKAIADGPRILNYVRETAADNGIDQKIRFNHRVKRASWSSQDARWTVEAQREDTQETVHLTCNFLLMCSGYYRYDEGYTPDFEGTERFAGRIVHPQHWSEDVDYTGKRVVVIGSGATAVTLVPARHWSARTLSDRNMSLWASFVIETPGGNIYFVADSGYGDGWYFRRARERHGPFRLAVLPIGAYEPRWFMRDQHMNPAESVQALIDCGAEIALAHHYGTFQLTDEPFDAPLVALADALKAGGISPQRFRAMRPGQVWQL